MEAEISPQSYSEAVADMWERHSPTAACIRIGISQQAWESSKSAAHSSQLAAHSSLGKQGKSVCPASSTLLRDACLGNHSSGISVVENHSPYALPSRLFLCIITTAFVISVTYCCGPIPRKRCMEEFTLIFGLRAYRPPWWEWYGGIHGIRSLGLRLFTAWWTRMQS